MGTSTSSTIKINLHAGLVKNAQKEANRIGISLQDFIRMLLGNYFASPVMRKEEYYQKLLDQAHADIKAGKFTTIKTQVELDKYLRSLSE